MKDHLITIGIMLAIVAVFTIVVILSMLTKGLFLGVVVVAGVLFFIYVTILDYVKAERHGL